MQQNHQPVRSRHSPARLFHHCHVRARSLQVFAIVATFTMSVSPAFALVLFWDVDSGDWSNAANWDLLQTPTADDNVYIDNNGTATVNTAGEVADYLYVGEASSGSLRIEDAGTLAIVGTRIGNEASGNGSVTVTGAGSTWTISSLFDIGYRGSGTVNVEAGGALETVSANISATGDGTGSVTVTGAGSIWSNSGSLVVGRFGSGSLNVENGGTVETAAGVIGSGGDSTGSVTVTGVGSSWTNSGNLTVGNFGTGTLTITTGSAVDTQSARIGFNNGGAGSVTLADGGTMNVDAGAGTIDLGSDSSSSGSLTIGSGGAAGILNAASINGGAGTAMLNFNHTDSDYVFSRDGTGGTAGVAIQGYIAVNHSGTGTTILTADNTYTGLTTISAGTLQIGNGGTSGSVTGDIVNNSQLVFDRSDDLIYAGDISGSGSLIRNGGGNFVTLTGTNTYTGGTTINSRILRIGNGGTSGSVIGDITNNDILTFNRSDDISFAGAISGEGALIKDGAGALVLTGNNNYTGGTTIDDGTLVVNGDLSASSEVTVRGDGTTLRGAGVFSTVLASDGGTIAPGNSIGTMTITDTGPFQGIVFGLGSIYEVEVDADGNSDLIEAAGLAYLGGRVEVLPQPGDYADSTDYTILTAGDSLDGTFDGVAVTHPDFAFLDATLSYDANNVFLNLARNDTGFDAIGNGNQQSVGAVLNQLAESDPQSVQTLLDNLMVLTPEQAQAALDSLSGVQLSHSQQVLRNSSQQFQSLLFDRLAGSGFTGDGSVAMSFSGERWAEALERGHRTMSGRNAGADMRGTRGVWLRGIGGFGEIDADANATGADYDYAGVVAGVDTALNDTLTAGIAVGYTRSQVDVFAGDLDIDSYQAAVYGGWRQDADYIANYIQASVGGGWHETDSSRMVIAGALSQSASADYDSQHFAIQLEAGRDHALGQATVTPFAGLDYTYLQRNGFTETGANQTNLSVAGEDQDSLRTRFGVRFGRSFTSAGGMHIRSNVEAAYVRELLDDEARITAGFTASPAARFTVSGPELSRNRAQLGAGVVAQLTDRASLGLRYQGELASSDDNHAFSATLRLIW